MFLVSDDSQMSKRRQYSRNHTSPAPTEIGVSSPLKLRIVAGITAIILITFLAYLPSINGGFILDDDIYLTNNQFIKSSDGLYQFWLTAKPIDYYPISNGSLWIEWRMWGMNTMGYHSTNLLLHAAEALLVWIILRKLFIPGAFLAAFIFAVHPVNVESVAWIAQRKEMLAMLFFLLSILWYLKAETHSAPPQDHFYQPIAGPLYWLSLLAFVLAMLSKGSATVLPVLLLAIVWWQRSLTRCDMVRTAPFFLLAAALTVVNIWFQMHSTEKVIRAATFVERLLGAGGVVWFYLYNAFLPLNLVFVYPQWDTKAGNPLWWAPFLAALIVTAVLWRYRAGWSRPYLFAWAFFCVALAPVMGFMDVGFMEYSLVADHYQHIAIIGVITLAAAGWSAWRQWTRKAAYWAATAVAILVLGALVFLSWRKARSIAMQRLYIRQRWKKIKIAGWPTTILA